MSKFIQRKPLLLLFTLLCLTGFNAGYTASTQASRPHVILLSIDGLKPDYVTEADKHGLKVPNLRRFVKEGAFATGVKGVAPTVTYPSHTTLITGVSPSVHGILNNSPFDPFGKNASGWYWYAEDIQTPTLWDVARQAGLVTANVDWPVSVGAGVDFNIPQFWRAEVNEDHKLLRALATKGLLEEAEKECGTYPAGYQYDLPDDVKRAKFIAWMIERKRPQFMTAYFSSLDEAQHHTAPYSKTTFETLAGLDALVGQVRAAAERAFKDNFVLAIVSDHGHITADKEIHFNAALQQAGLLELDAQQKLKTWRAYAWSGGGSVGVLLKDPADTTARQQVREVLKRLALDPANGIEQVSEGAELKTMGGFPQAAFVVGLKPGFKTGGGLTGAVARSGKAGGTHGYLPGPRDMQASFFIAGAGVPAGQNLGSIDMRDVAPTLAELLGLKLAAAEGRNLLTGTQ
jgi:predicted AlkP superfamily pyrophosphatase or phosphodiesterase